MYIAPLLLLVPEFAADFCEENEQLFDSICLRKYEYLDDFVSDIYGCCNICIFAFSYGYGDALSIYGSGSDSTDFGSLEWEA